MVKNYICYTCTMFKKGYETELFKDFDFKIKVEKYNNRFKNRYMVAFYKENEYNPCNVTYIDFDTLKETYLYCKNLIKKLKKENEFIGIYFENYSR